MTTPDLWRNARRVMPAGTPKSALLLLHGLGSNADDLIELAPYLAPALPDTVFISPNAPFACDMAPYGFQWFSLLDRTPAKVLAGVQAAAPQLEQMIEDVRTEFNLPYNRIALLGFSQGSMMSLHIGTRLPEPLAAVIGLSGALIGPELLEGEIRSRPPVLLVHGQQDPIVPYTSMAAAEDVLRRNNIEVMTETRPDMQHNVDDVTLQRSADFLRKHLA